MVPAFKEFIGRVIKSRWTFRGDSSTEWAGRGGGVVFQTLEIVEYSRKRISGIAREFCLLLWKFFWRGV